VLRSKLRYLPHKHNFDPRCTPRRDSLQLPHCPSYVLVRRTVNIWGPHQRRKKESDVVIAGKTQTETLSTLRIVSGSQNTRVMSQRDVIDYNQPPIGLLPRWIIM
jgi:hypothetical protein